MSSGPSQARASRRGFTLLELALATSLISMVALGFAAVYNTSQVYMISAITTSDLQGGAAFALRHITRNLRAAMSAGVDPGPPVAGGLSITVPQPGTYIAGTPPVTMAYFFDTGNGTLVWIPDVANRGTTVVLAQNVTAFQAVDLGGGPVDNTTRVVRFGITTWRNNRNFVLSTSTSMRGKT